MKVTIRRVRKSFEASIEDRKGAFANQFMLSEAENAVILDAILIDSVEENEKEILHSGILTSRIVMTRESAIELRDLLERHISGSEWGNDDAR